MSSRLTGTFAALGCAVAAVLVTACGQDSPAGQQQSATAPLTVVASTNVWSSVAAAVGGKHVQVSSVVGDTGDPHSYQVSAKDAATLRAAGLVIYNGGGYDDWVEQALGPEEQGPRRIKAVDLHPDTQPNGVARRAHDTGENEHVWYDLPTVAQMAGEIASQLAQLRPAAKATFIANADTFDLRLDELEGRVSELSVARPGTAVAATEPLGHYLLKAAALQDRTPHDFVDAVEEETDPPAAAVAELQQMITDRQVAALVHNPQTETPVVADLVDRARRAGLPVIELTETLPAGQDYLTWMGSQIQALSTALRP